MNNQNLNLDIINRIMQVLYGNPSLKKTQITAKAALNYPTTIKYLNWLEKMNFLITKKSNTYKNSILIKLSEEGVTFYKIISK